MKAKAAILAKHAVAKFVRLLPLPLIAREVEWFGLAAFTGRLIDRVLAQVPRLRGIARTEREHTMLVVGRDGPLCLHGCRLRDVVE